MGILAERPRSQSYRRPRLGLPAGSRHPRICRRAAPATTAALPRSGRYTIQAIAFKPRLDGRHVQRATTAEPLVLHRSHSVGRGPVLRQNLSRPRPEWLLINYVEYNWFVTTADPQDAHHLASGMFEALRLAEEDHPAGIQHPEIEDQVLLLTYGRVVALFNAAGVLIREGIAHEALLIGRSLFEDSLRLHHVARSPADGRSGLVSSILLRQLRDDVRLSYAMSSDSGRDKSIRESELWAQFYPDYVRDRGIRVTRMPDDTALVRMYASSALRYAWLLAQQQVHGATTAHTGRYAVDAHDILRYIIKDAGPELLGLPVQFATRSLGIAREAMTDLFGWPPCPALPGLMR